MKKLITFLIITFCLCGCSMSTVSEITNLQLMDKISDALGKYNEDLTEISQDLYSAKYGIDKSKFKEVIIYGSEIDLSPNQIILIKAVDSSNLEEAKKTLEDRLGAQDTLWKNFLPAQYELVKKGIIKTKAMYAVLIISENADKALVAFYKNLK